MNIRKLNLRELMIERILFNVSEEDLYDMYEITLQDLQECSDEEFLETYDEITEGCIGY